MEESKSQKAKAASGELGERMREFWPIEIDASLMANQGCGDGEYIIALYNTSKYKYADVNWEVKVRCHDKTTATA